MKNAVQKNHLGGQILYRSHNPVKNGVNCIVCSGESNGLALSCSMALRRNVFDGVFGVLKWSNFIGFIRGVPMAGELLLRTKSGVKIVGLATRGVLSVR